MRKEQFLRELEALLQDISEQERMEAMQYYRDYFDDAGPENEEKIIEELGSPGQVARTIKAGVTDNAGEFSECGYRDARFADSQELGPRETGGSSGGRDGEESRIVQRKKTNGWKIACIVLICILLLPVILPVGAGLLGLLIGAAVCIGAAVVGIAAIALALLVAGAVVIAVGIAKAFLMPAVGIALAGVGFLLLAAGILAAVLIVWCCVKVLPVLIRGMVHLCSIPFRKRKEAAAG